MHTNKNYKMVKYFLSGLFAIGVLSIMQTTTFTSAQTSQLQNNCLGTGGLASQLVTFLNAKFVSNWTVQNKCTGDLAISVSTNGDLLSGNVLQAIITVTNVGSRWSYGNTVDVTANQGLIVNGGTIQFGQMGPGASQTQRIFLTKSASSPTAVTNATITFTVANTSINDINSANNTVTLTRQVKKSNQSTICYHPGLNIPSYECDALVEFYQSTNGAGWTNKTNWISSPNVDSWYGIQTTKQSDLVAYYSFDANNSTDDSGNGFNGSNANIAYASGVINRSATFNGSSSAINIGSSVNSYFATGGFTISAWIKTSNMSEQAIFTVIDANANNYLLFRKGNSNPDLRIAIGGTELVNTNFVSEIRNGDWVMITTTYTPGSTAKLYVNGVLDRTVAVGNNQINLGSIAAMIGRDGRGSMPFNGEIDDFRIYNRPLSDTEVTSLYETNTVGENVRMICLAHSTEAYACNQSWSAGGIAGNNLAGTLPASIGSLSELYQFNINKNAVGGTIPTTIGNLKKISYFYASDNQFTGTIPTTIGGATALSQLNLSNNNINGQIPQEISSTNMNIIWLNNNKLTGPIPDLSARNWGQFQIANNLFTGELPAWIGSEQSLSYIAMQSNQFSGPIPDTWKNLTSLTTLYLYNNNIVGSLDVFSGLNVSNWQNFQVQNNNLDRDSNNYAIVPSNIQARLSSMASQNLTNQGDITPPRIGTQVTRLPTNHQHATTVRADIAGPQGQIVSAMYFGGNPYHVYYQKNVHNIDFQVGKSYTLSFWARTVSGTRTLRPAFSDNTNDGMKYGTTQTIDTSWRLISVTATYTASMGTNPRMFITWDATTGQSPFYIYDPVVTEFNPIGQTIDGSFSYDITVTENSSTTGAGFPQGLSVSFTGSSICQQALYTSDKVLNKNGTTTITVTAFEPVTYNGCQVYITDRAGLISNLVVLPTFTSNEYGICNVITDITKSDCKALIDLYQSTNGNNWTNKTNWKGLGDSTPTTACDWYGVQCSGGRVYRLYLGGVENPTFGTACDNNSASFIGNNLSGSLSDSIGNLTGLNVLCLPSNNIVGPLPSTLGNLTGLWALALFNNPINSPLPSTLHQLSNLQYLTMHNAGLQGLLDPSWGLSLINMKRISLASNQLSGSLPSSWYHLLDTAITISLASNQLSGSLPSSWGTTAPNLTTLYLQNNQFSGPIPSSWGNFTAIKELHLRNNKLEGFIPDSIGNLTGLNGNGSSLNNNCLSPSTSYMSPGLVSILNSKFSPGGNVWTTQNNCPGSIQGKVWNDATVDGSYVSPETMRSGVTATLKYCTDQTIVNSAIKTLEHQLIAHYTFDEDTATDVSNNSNDLTTNNGVTYVAGIFGKAANWAGGLRYLLKNPTPNFPISQISTSMWVRKTANGHNLMISYASSATDNDFIMTYNGTNLEVWVAGQGYYLPSADIALENNQWIHMAVTWDTVSGELKVYKNGIAVHNTIFTAARGRLITPGGSLVLGSEQDAVAGGWDANQVRNGQIDEVRIYSRVLSATEVAQLYNMTSSHTSTNIPINYAGSTVATATTASNGSYSFANVNPGKYYVEFTNIPNEYKFTTQNIGGWANTVNSKVNPWSAKTSCFELYNGLNEGYINAGLQHLPHASCETTSASATPMLLGEPVTVSVAGYGTNAALQVRNGASVLLNQTLNNQGSNWALKTWTHTWTPTAVGTLTLSGSVDGSTDRLEYYQSATSSTAYKVLGDNQRCAVQGNMGPATSSLTTINQIATIPSPISYCTPAQVSNGSLPYATANNQPTKILIRVPNACTSTLVVTTDLNMMCDYITDMTPAECKALVTLHNQTNGTNWTNKTRWNFKGDATPRTACDWYGVSCAAGKVTQLNIHANNLIGSISAVPWSAFSSLQTLSLYDNNLTGPLPTTISSISTLQTIRLGYNSFDGSIPTTWSSLSAINEINLAQAGSFNGTLPTQWSALAPTLTKLNLAGVFTQTGQIIPTTISSFTKLQELYLSDNDFFDQIGTKFNNLTGLKTLQLQNNQIYGDLQVSNLPRLTALYTSSHVGDKSAIDNNCLYINKVGGTTGAFLDARFKFTSNPATDWRNQKLCDTDLELTSAAKSGNLLTGLLMTYTIDYKNIGSLPSFEPKLEIILHNGLYVMSGSSVVASGNWPMIIDLPALQPGATGQYTFTISKMGLGSGLHSIVNQFKIVDATVGDINTTNNTFTDAGVARGSSYPVCVHPDISIQTYECESLGDFYYWTNGPSWTNKSNWLLSPNVSSWFGITLTNINGTNYVQKICLNTASTATACQDYWLAGTVGNSLSGTLAPTLGYLSYLKELRLASNNISGVIPSSFADLDRVTDLVLQNNKLTSIGTGLAGMAELVSLRLGQNPITVLDNSIVNIPKLTYLDASYTSITALPTMTNLCDTLVVLYINNNALNTAVPTWLSSCTKLVAFRANNAGFTGTVTNQLTMSSLSTVELHNNNLTGPLPSLGANVTLVNLSSNKFTGVLPSSWSSLTKLQSLNLSMNTGLNSTLPSSWSSLTKLQLLNLSGANIAGMIPQSWFPAMTGMQQFIIPNTYLDGPVPISGLQSWTFLATNPIISTVANNCMYTGFANTAQQQWMDTFLSWRQQKPCDTDLQITMAKSGTNYDPGKVIVYTITYANNGPRWSYLPKINVVLNTGLVLSGTLNNTISYDLGYLQPGQSGQVVVTAVKRGTGQGTGWYTNTFNISDAATIDTITGNNTLIDSGVIRWFKYNECIDVSDVPQLECEAVMDLYTFTNGSNWTTKTKWAGINDDTQNTLCDWYGITCAGGRITRLCLAGTTTQTQCQDAWIGGVGNNLSGDLLGTIGDLAELTGLYLGRNNLKGQIPPQLTNLKKLQTLSLGQNKFTVLPSLVGMSALQTLHIHNNPFATSLPTWISQMTGLRTLTLYGSQMTGPLPVSWTGARSLSYISIGNNNFAGHSLPSTWSTMSGLRDLYIANSQLQGSLPSSWSTLTGIVNLQFSNNNLTGTLPSSWSTLKALQTLHVGSNNLTGTLPTQWSSMSALKELRLHNNNFGETSLPSSWSALTNLEYLDVSQANLAGMLPSSWSALTKLKTLRINTNGFVDEIPPSWFTGMTSMNALIAYDNDLAGPIDVPLWQGWANLNTSGADSVISNNCLYTGSVIGGYGSWMDTYFGAQFIKPGSSWAPQYYWKNQKPCPADLALTGMVVTGNLYTGAFMTYTIKYQNLGKSWAYNPQLVVMLHSGLELLSGGDSTSISLGYLRPYTSGTIVIPIKKVGIGSGQEVFTNTFVISDMESIDNDLTNNTLVHTGIVKWFKYPICGTIQDISQAECEALGDFYTDLNGTGWTNKANWMGLGDATDTTACDWYGITCAASPTPTVSPRTVTQLCMSHHNTAAACNYGSWSSGGTVGNNLVGTLPLSIGDLVNLTRLTLERNTGVSGPIPSTIGNLNKVQALSLRDMSLTGPIPNEITQMSELTMLGLTNNNFTGPLPATLFNMPKLHTIHGQNMGVSGPIPTSGTAPMGQIHLNNNKLSGSIPTWITQKNLSWLTLNNNQLSGPLPSTWTNGGSLAYLHLANNNFTGPLPIWTTITKLQSLSLGNNTGLAMNGIPAWIGANIELNTIDMQHMNLTGTLPSSWSALTKLATLRLNNNNLNDELPSSWSALTGLNTLWLQNNNLDGPIPTRVQTSYAVLGNNSSQIANNCMYTGHITSTFRAYMNLKFGDNWQAQKICQADPAFGVWSTSGSLFTGNTIMYTIRYHNFGPHWSYEPQITANLFNGLTAYSITGNIQTSTGSSGNYITSLGHLRPGQSGLIYYTISKQYFTGTDNVVFTNNFGINDSKVIDVNTGNNTLTHTGQVRGSAYPICRHPNLTISQTECEVLGDFYYSTNGDNWTNKSNWMTSPNVEAWFGVSLQNGHVVGINLTSPANDEVICDVVIAGGNNVQGAIPNTIEYLTQLKTLCLGNNKITTIPSQINKLSQLNQISLHHNTVKFTTPLSITGVKYVDISYNALTGSASSYLGSLPQIQYLFMNNNALTTGLSQVFTYGSLQTLQLHNNIFRGSLSSGFTSLTALRSLTLHANYFDRDDINDALIPVSLGAWYNALQTKTRHLQGDIIPPQITNVATMPTVSTGISIITTMNIIENSYASGLHTAGPYSGQTLSGMRVFVTSSATPGSEKCNTVTADLIKNHYGTVVLRLYPQIDGVYDGCMVSIYDRANLQSNATFLSTFNYTQPPYRLHIMAGGSGTTMTGTTSLLSINDLSEFNHQITMVGGAPIYSSQALNNNPGFQFAWGQSLMMPGIFRNQHFNDVTILAVVNPGTHTNVIYEQTQYGDPVALRTNEWTAGGSTITFDSPTNHQSLITATHKGAGQHAVRINGVQKATTSSVGGIQLSGASVTVIGSGLTQGFLGEMIVYTKQLEPVQLQYLESYFALKYGLTLPSNYLAIGSGGSIITTWTANSTFQHQVIGIGKNENTLLKVNQIKSSSAQSGTITLHARGTRNNGDYVMVGSTSGELQRTTPLTSIVGYQRLGRIWKVQKTQSNLAFDISITDHSIAPFNFAPIYVVSSNADFTNIVASGSLVQDGELWYMSGVNVQDGHYVSFAIAQSSVGGRVWIDYNRDGIQSPSEPSVQGVKVSLYACPPSYANAVQPVYIYNRDKGSLTPIATITTSTGLLNILFDHIPPGAYYMTYDRSQANITSVDGTAGGMLGTRNADNNPGRYTLGGSAWSDYESYTLWSNNKTSKWYGNMETLSGLIRTQIDSDMMSNDYSNSSLFIPNASKCYTIQPGVNKQDIGAGLTLDASTDLQLTQVLTQQSILNAPEIELNLDIVAKNIGNKTARYTQIVTTLPKGTSIAEITKNNIPLTSGINYIMSGNQLQIYLNTLVGGQEEVFRINFVYDGSVDDGTTLSFDSKLLSTTLDPNHANNQAPRVGVLLTRYGATIGDKVWIDTNRNNLQDTGEPGAVGVVVQLFKADGILAKEQRITSSSGTYLFTSVQPGDYYITFTNIPLGYDFVQRGTNQEFITRDSNVYNDDPDNKTSIFTVGSQDNLTIDAGLKAVDPLLECSVVNRKKLRVGQTYSYFTDFLNPVSDVKITKITRIWTEKADYNNNTTLPNFVLTNAGKWDFTQPLKIGFIKGGIGGIGVQTVSSSINPYTITRSPAQRTGDNMVIAYNYEGSVVNLAGTPMRAYQQRSCYMYEITTCGDGIIDSYDDSYLGEDWGSEHCDHGVALNNGTSVVDGVACNANCTINTQRVADLAIDKQDIMRNFCELPLGSDGTINPVGPGGMPTAPTVNGSVTNVLNIQ